MPGTDVPAFGGTSARYRYSRDQAPGPGIECRRAQATDFATRELMDRRVAVLIDSPQDERDRYGRLLAFVERDDSGWVYTAPKSHAPAPHEITCTRTSRHNCNSRSRLLSRKHELPVAGLWGPPCNGGR